MLRRGFELGGYSLLYRGLLLEGYGGTVWYYTALYCYNMVGGIPYVEPILPGLLADVIAMCVLFPLDTVRARTVVATLSGRGGAGAPLVGKAEMAREMYTAEGGGPFLPGLSWAVGRVVVTYTVRVCMDLAVQRYVTHVAELTAQVQRRDQEQQQQQQQVEAAGGGAAVVGAQRPLGGYPRYDWAHQRLWSAATAAASASVRMLSHVVDDGPITAVRCVQWGGRIAFVGVAISSVWLTRPPE
jgi:hypothetical protein